MQIYKSALRHERFLLTDYSKRYIAELSDEYEKLKETPVPELTRYKFDEFKRSGNRTEYEKDYFLRRTMLRDFALKAWLGDNGAAEHLERIIDAVCNEFTWILPAHEGKGELKTSIDLFAAETAQSLTEIISLLSGRLSPQIIDKALDEVRQRVLLPFINRREKYGWETARSNWSAVCGGCIGMTAIYLIDDGAELKRLTDSLASVFESYLESFASDGACKEGLYYWGYGMTYFTAFLDLYYERFGVKFPTDYEKLTKMADFAHSCCISDGITASFSDSGERDRIYSGLSSWLTEHFGAAEIPNEYMAYLRGDDCGRWCRAARDIAWTRDRRGTTLPKISILPDAQWVVMRSEKMSAAFKGGNNGEPHNHNDAGSFMAIKNGDVILCDIGAGEYTREYFSEDRYNVLCCSSFGHSVPLVNGQPQKTGAEYGAADFAASGHSVFADISGAYGAAELKSLIRSVTLRDDSVTVTDAFKTDARAAITERFITRHNVKITENGAEIIINGKRAAVISSEQNCKIRVTEHAHREHDGAAVTVYAVDFEFDVRGNGRFTLTVR